MIQMTDSRCEFGEAACRRCESTVFSVPNGLGQYTDLVSVKAVG